MNQSAQYVWLIPALPLMAAAAGALASARSRKLPPALAIAAMAAAFVLSVTYLIGSIRGGGVAYYNFDWFDLGTGTVRLGWMIDPLAACMLTMVTFVGLLIFIFSLGYMRDDPNVGQFFTFLAFFASAMLGVVIANSLLLLFIAWELVGLASYLLIGFWFQKPEAALAARKAFITTRIGDLGLFLGMLWLYDATGSLLFYDNGAGVLEATVLGGLSSEMVGAGMIATTAISLLIFCGAAGKSGQVPLHVWLPDAMEGPTPVSALIHAATMVAAGVFLVARVYPLMAADRLPAIVTSMHALDVVAWIGAITALFGALVAVAQTDIKRILAFSTVSQLGYMMLAAGVGSWTAAIFHLLTHAFFKALLFLGAGSVIHAAHHEQDIRRLGGLGPRMRWTFATFAIGMLALAGVPFLFSGFWSKEAILHAAHGWPVSPIPLYFALAAVLLTAFYMTRLVAEAFKGSARSEEAAHAHESPAVMTVPLVILAICAVGLGFLGTPAWPWLQRFLSGQEIEAESVLSGGGLLWLSVALVGIGIALGWMIYGRHPRVTAGAPDPLAARLPGPHAALAHRLRFDEFYAATVGRAHALAAHTADFLDRRVWGGAISLLARVGLLFGWVNRDADEGGLNAGFDGVSEGLRGTGQIYSRRQTGDIGGYLRAAAIAFILLTLLIVLGGSR